MTILVTSCPILGRSILRIFVGIESSSHDLVFMDLMISITSLTVMEANLVSLSTFTYCGFYAGTCLNKSLFVLEECNKILCQLLLILVIWPRLQFPLTGKIGYLYVVS